MSECSWCGREINGKPVLSIINSAILMDNGETKTEIMPGYEADFCCHGCAWAFAAETHRLMGLSGKDLRNHLINVHGFGHPPGKPAGSMRQDCIVIVLANILTSRFY